MENKGAPVIQFISLTISLVILLGGLALTTQLELFNKCIYKGPWSKIQTGPCASNNNTAEVKGIRDVAIFNPEKEYQGKFTKDFNIKYDLANVSIAEEKDQLYLIPINYSATEENIRIKQYINGIIEMNQDDCEKYYYDSAWFPNSILDKAEIISSVNGNICKLNLTENSLEESYQYKITIFLHQDTQHNRTWEITKTILSTTTLELEQSLDLIIDSFTVL